jgi:viroplasmin and RNaseH domain-containing protein
MGENGNSHRKKDYYAVAIGRKTGIFTDWSLCNEQVDRFSGNCYAGFDTTDECVQFIKAKKGIAHDQGIIMVYHDDTVVPLPQYTQQRINSSNADNENSADLPIFDRLSVTIEFDAFAAVYCDNLPHIYEYDKKEITNFLEGSGTGDQSHKDKLLTLRLQLYEKLCVIFPVHVDSEMYHRRVPDTISEDIYIIGNSIVNQRLDKRLSKVLKTSGTTNNQESVHDASVRLIESTDLIETCVVLRDTVTNLTTVVSNLSGEVVLLREKMALLELRLAPDTQIPLVTEVNSQVATDNSNNDDSERTQTDAIPTQPDNMANTSVEQSSTIQDPVVRATPQISDTGILAPSVSSETSDFRLPERQRRQIRRGFNIQPSTRSEIIGTVSGEFSITGVTGNQTNNIRTIYVGKVKVQTSHNDIRRHLREIGVSHISDVIQLPCRVPGEASFCVTVDAESDEEIIFNADNWPTGVRIRSYKERSAARVSQSQGQRLPSNSWQQNNHRRPMHTLPATRRSRCSTRDSSHVSVMTNDMITGLLGQRSLVNHKTRVITIITCAGMVATSLLDRFITTVIEPLL